MNLKPLLTLSLTVNLVLAGAFLWAMKRTPPGRSPAPAVAPAERAKLAESQPVAAGAVATPVAMAPPAEQFNWRTVESADYKKYIANLRAIGCPDETIRDIITADVNKLFEERRRRLAGAKTNRFEYWKAGNQMFAQMFDEEKIKGQQQLAKEKRQLLTELLGAAPEEKPDLMAMMGGVNPLEDMLDFLSPAKQTAAMEIEQKYAAKLMKAVGGGDAESFKDMAKVQKEKDAELAGVLTPEEFEDYQLRMSQTAMVMRMQMASFDPNEKEFRDIFKLKKSFEDEFGMGGMGATEKVEREKRQAAEKQMNEQLKSLLGDTRYTEYERSQDHNFQSMSRVAERNGLGPDAAIKVYEMKKTAEDQARTVRGDTSLTKEQRATALAGIRTETESAVQSVFGEKGFKSYQSQGGYWLRGISPDPKPASNP